MNAETKRGFQLDMPCCESCACHTEHGSGPSGPAGGRDIHAGGGIKDSSIIYLNGLCCPGCAQEIENEAVHIKGVTSAKVDFAARRLTIEANAEDMADIVQRVSETVLRIEPGIRISYAAVQEKKPREAEFRRALHFAALCAGAALFAAALIFGFSYWLKFGLFLASYMLVGGEVVLRAARSIIKGRVFNENFLMSLATISAFAIGEFPEGVAVMLFYQAGELLQGIAVGRSRRSIAALMDIRPDYANVKRGDGVQRISPEEARVGDVIIVRPGERVPLDGRVTEGNSSLDTSALTGESAPHDVGPGDEALSGSVNHNGLLTIEVTKLYGESTLNKILDLVQNAASKKAPVENFITRFSRYYTPAVVFAALALAVLPPLVIPGAAFEDYINRALVFLMVSCPCALVISVPLGFFGGIGGASRNGILIKGSNYLEALTKVDTMVFDKTGTLTKGVFKVSGVVSAGAFSKEELIEYAALAEAHSNHPIAVSIREANTGKTDAQSIAEYEEIPGKGVRANAGGKELLVGNAALMEQENVEYKKADTVGTTVYIAADRRFAGYIIISDEIKPDGRRAIEELKRAGVGRMVMLTGDSFGAAEKTAGELGIDEFYAGLLPHEKVEKLERLENAKGAGSRIAFVGDGVNDAPALARADIGIAMGGAGSDAAIEAADIVLMTDEPLKIADAVRAAKRTNRIVWQNIIFALAVKGAILALGAAGITTMWEAVFGDVGVALIAVLNSARAIRIK